jgi:putative DNA primase/helicase
MRKPALASLIGTVNNDAGFLFDSTGNRRFMGVTLTAIDFAYATEVDVDQVWAEAVAAYRAGEPWRLTGPERDVQTALNETYEADDPLVDRLRRSCDFEKDAFTPTADLIAWLHQKDYRASNDKALAMELSKAAKKLGLRKGDVTFDGKQQKGYWGIKPQGKVEEEDMPDPPRRTRT